MHNYFLKSYSKYFRNFDGQAGSILAKPVLYLLSFYYSKYLYNSSELLKR